MAEQNKKGALKHVMINLGVMLVLVGSTAVKGDNLTFFFMGLILLALQIFDFKGVAPAKLVTTRTVLFFVILLTPSEHINLLKGTYGN